MLGIALAATAAAPACPRNARRFTSRCSLMGTSPAKLTPARAARSGTIEWPSMAILDLPGGTALRDFRLAKLNLALAPARLLVTATQHWHFVELEHDPSPGERATLERLLSYGPDLPPPPEVRGRMALVTPRLGTISPWSSKATDIARQCGLEFVRRIERGTVFHLEGDGELRDVLRRHDCGYHLCLEPFVSTADTLIGTTQLPKFEADMFAVNKGGVDADDAAAAGTGRHGTGDRSSHAARRTGAQCRPDTRIHRPEFAKARDLHVCCRPWDFARRCPTSVGLDWRFLPLWRAASYCSRSTAPSRYYSISASDCSPLSSPVLRQPHGAHFLTRVNSMRKNAWHSV